MQAVGQGFKSPYLQIRGFEPEPSPNECEEKAPGWHRQKAEAGWREQTGSLRPEAKSPYLQIRGFEPEPSPNECEEKAPGWRRQKAEAGWREQTGGLRPEAKSPYLQIRERGSPGIFERGGNASTREGAGAKSPRGGLCGKDNMVKRKKGLWRMPWSHEARKAAASCEKPGGGAHILGSPDGRMG